MADVEVKPIPGKPGYYAADTDQGEVYRVTRMTGYKMQNGYIKVCFSVNNKRIWDLMHRVIARTFIKPDLRTIDEVDHKNKDKTLNGTEHIQIVTRAVNLFRRDKGYNQNQKSLEEEPF